MGKARPDRSWHDAENPESAFNLCKKRKRILTHEGHMLVTGGPGSGKTTIALLKARRWTLQHIELEQKILFLSFSNSAIRRILEGADRIFTSEIGKHVEIKTYHSFAWEVLSSHGYLISSQRRLRIVSAQDAAVLSAGLTKDEWLAKQSRLFIEDGLVTYDQFAPRAAELLRRSSVVRACFCATFPLILVDEFQDTDEDQWALIQTLSRQSQIVALGDTEQRIYDWRPGVSETRLQEFVDTLVCERFDFASENNRSAATGIAGFARSLLSPGAVQNLPDEIVRYQFKPGRFSTLLHLKVREAFRQVKRVTRGHPKIAVAARSNLLVRRISDALSRSVTINGRAHPALAHDVLIDQSQVLLAARVVANILSTVSSERNQRMADALDRIADMLRSTGKKTNIRRSDTMRKWATKCRAGNAPTTKCVTALANVMGELDKEGLSGVPTQDWRRIRNLLDKAKVEELKKVADLSRYLRLLRSGSAIEQTLISLWVSQGDYEGAEAALEQAILQAQLVDAHREAATITVMNMHQLKGREYDAVVLVEDVYNTFMAKDTTPPHAETRRLLQVALTRARHYAVILSNQGGDTFGRILS